MESNGGTNWRGLAQGEDVGVSGKRMRRPPDPKSAIGSEEPMLVEEWSKGMGKGSSLSVGDCCMLLTWLFQCKVCSDESVLFVGVSSPMSCKILAGEQLMYLCLHRRHTQGDQDKAQGVESLARRAEDNLERYPLLHLPRLLSVISTGKISSEPGLIADGTDR
jgi:hypothetical protein